MRSDQPLMSCPAVFPQANPLPSTQSQMTPDDRHRNARCGQRGADVGGHIVVAFSRVHKHRISITYQPVEKGLQVTANIRVRILLNQQRGRSVPNLQGDQAVVEAFPRNPITDLLGEFIKTASAGRDSKLV